MSATVMEVDREMEQQLTIETGSRLHFGLLAFGDSKAYRYGGIGVMLRRPGVRLKAVAANEFRCSGRLSERVISFAEHWARAHNLTKLPGCQIDVARCAPQHTGLGTGTQLGMSVAALLSAWSAPERVAESVFHEASVPKIAASVGRGKRSSVGTYGFALGGLIYELGKGPSEAIGKLAHRVELPESWRVVVWTPLNEQGLSGRCEQQAFDQVPTVPTRTTERLLEIANKEIIPNAKDANLDAFGDAVYRYGYEAGECFAAQQGGPFASQQLEHWVEAVRRRGITGVGQSSWGPSLFAFTPDDSAAQSLADWFVREVAGDTRIETTITPIANQAARLCWSKPESG